MRIAYIITRGDSVGGAQVHVRDLGKALLKQGHDVMVLVGGEGDYTVQLQQSGIPHRSLRFLTRSLRPLRDTVAVTEIRRHLAAFQPQLVSTHSSKAGFLGRLAARSLRIPAIFTAHSWAFTVGTGAGRWLVARAERVAARFAARIITVSDYDRWLALRFEVCSEDKVVTVHNGVPDVSEQLRAEPQRQPPRILMVARFQRQKDHQTLLQALSGLCGLDWELTLVGDGPLRLQMEAVARSLRLSERVRFVGTRYDVAELMASAQIYTLTSNWEGLPRSIIEGMRAGLPVVASDVGGVCELVTNGETGYLVGRRNPDMLRDRLGRLIGDAHLRASFGAAARRNYEDRFGFDRMARETIQIYQEVLGEHRSC